MHLCKAAISSKGNCDLCNLEPAVIPVGFQLPPGDWQLYPPQKITLQIKKYLREWFQPMPLYAMLVSLLQRMINLREV